MGDVGIVPSFLDGANLTENAVKLTGSQADCDPFYLKYSLLTEDAQAQMKLFAAGAAQPKLGIYKVKDVEIPYPPLPIQRRIASILSAYDDLIENNTRRIAALEAAAQALYREWFVEFRFPGHEEAEWVEASPSATLELGAIPAGWEVKAVGELLDHQIGGGWGKDEPDDNHTRSAYVIRGTDIPGARHLSIGNCPLRFHKQSNFNSRQLEPGDIVFEVSGGSKDQPVGRAILISHRLLDASDEDVICASFCKLVRPNTKTLRPELLYLHFLEIYVNGQIEQYQVQSTGICSFAKIDPSMERLLSRL